jgi:ABC-type Fe3+/spermidine/putrescine transport system ATPase subunit
VSEANGAPIPPDVRLVDVVKAFAELRAVDGISLEIPRGSFFALLGPSGCGKTTTLRMIGGFEEPTEGKIFLGDRDVVGLPPYKRDVNTVFQSYALFPHMTVAENVAFGLERRKIGKTERRARVREVLELVDLAGREDRKPRQLSGGQQQRVAVARALAGKPAVLLADEPTGNLDSKNGDSVMLLLSELHKGGATIVMVTHDTRFARHAERTIHIFDGRVVQEQVEQH